MDASSQRRPVDLATRSQRALALFSGTDLNPVPTWKSQHPTDSHRLNPDFRLIRDGYEIRIANGADALKRNTARLIERMYSSRGLFPYGQGESLDERDITVAACKGDHAVATLTLCLDVGKGLLADTLYRAEIDAARKNGGKVCEITRLAMDPEHSSYEALAGMMQLLYLVARLTYRVTDTFIEVHPRHAGFYRRMLGYQMVGPEKICPRVGAPAVLMHLCQRRLDHLVDLHAGRSDGESRTIYRMFQKRSELEELQRSLVASGPIQNQRRTSI